MKSVSSSFSPFLLIGYRTKVCFNEVLFFEGDINYTRIFFRNGKSKMISRTLLHVQQRVDANDFVRVSRKHLVNRKFITQINHDNVILVNETALSISRRRRAFI
jgi:DNA-binding LytR/AlgR family response regulator